VVAYKWHIKVLLSVETQHYKTNTDNSTYKDKEHPNDNKTTITQITIKYKYKIRKVKKKRYILTKEAIK
jgi:hypothetical protein